MIESNGDETTTEANSQMETNAIDEPFIETDTQEDYFLPSETNMPIVIDEQENTPITEGSDIQPIGDDEPRQIDEDQPPPIQMDQGSTIDPYAQLQLHQSEDLRVQFHHREQDLGNCSTSEEPKG